MSPRQPIKLSDLDKNRMKHGGLLNKYFCKKKSNIPNDLAEIVNFHFFHYKSMGTISCHSNQSSYPTGLKTQHMPSFGFIPHMVSKKKILKHFLRKLTLFAAPTTNQIHRFRQKSYETVVEVYSINISVKKKSKYPQ